MNGSNHDAAPHSAAAWIIAFVAVALLLGLSVTWLAHPELRQVGAVSIAAMSLALVASLIVLIMRAFRQRAIRKKDTAAEHESRA